jgi:hypothetical protein
LLGDDIFVCSMVNDFLINFSAEGGRNKFGV